MTKPPTAIDAIDFADAEARIMTLITAPAPDPHVMVPDPALVREIELSYGNRKQRRAFDAAHRRKR
jgi:hypothetical protein